VNLEMEIGHPVYSTADLNAVCLLLSVFLFLHNAPVRVLLGEEREELNEGFSISGRRSKQQ